MRVAELWRFPVKSMRGERIDAAVVSDAGVPGDRAYALIDVETRKVASAKLPRLWGSLLQCEARTDADGKVVIALPDGTEVAADDPDVDDRLSAYVGRPVELASEAPTRSRYLAVWPEIDGVMPDDDRAAIGIGNEDDGTLTDLQLAMASPSGTFFDVAALHVVTTSTLSHLGFPSERFRPTVVIERDEASPFVENDWGTGATMTLGGVTASGLFPTMRCIMTTLAQGDLPRDNGVLQRIARENRVDLPGFGVWSCVGAYLSVSQPGRIAVGDTVAVANA
jgi:uncharacterized protein YcbX